MDGRVGPPPVSPQPQVPPPPEPERTKNLLVFAAPLFAFRFEAAVWLPACGALVAFCLISSSIYLLNDSLDVEADRQHPRKRYRPIAAGQVSVPLALTTSALLVVLSLTLAAAVSAPLAGVILAYGLFRWATASALNESRCWICSASPLGSCCGPWPAAWLQG